LTGVNARGGWVGRNSVEDTAMALDFALGAVVTAVVLAYLVYALLFPEKF
jgi:K+-transporting ATPase KdpF subunit